MVAVSSVYHGFDGVEVNIPLWPKIRRSQYSHTEVLLHFANKFKRVIILQVAVFVQMQLNVTAGFDGGRFATDLSHFAENADGAVGELLEVRGRDAGSGFGHDNCCLRDGVVVVVQLLVC